MSLSDLIASAKKAFNQYQIKNQSTDYASESRVFFFSISDGATRAQTFTFVATEYEQAWKQAAQALQKKIQQEKLIVHNLRVDWVVYRQTLTWKDIKQRLEKTKRNFFRLGLSLDRNFERAFLEQELNANSMLYPAIDKDESRAVLNEKNFTDYVKKKYPNNSELVLSDEMEMLLFSTAAVYVDVHEDQVFIAAPDAEKNWTHASHLNTGHRLIDTVTPELLYRTFDSATDFLAQQVQPDGRFIYGLYPCFDRPVPSYNTLRHASSLYSMLEGYEVTQSSYAIEQITKGINYLANQLIREYTVDDKQMCFLVDTGDEIKLGGNAVSILALVKYTQLTADQQFLPLMEKLALGFSYMQNPETGQFAHVFNASDLSLKELHRTVYYDGEATFALMRLYGLTKDERWIVMVEKAFEYFIAVNLSQAKDHWLSYCVNELTLYRPEEKYFYFGIQNVIHNLDFILNRETTYPTLLELMMAAENMLQRIKQMPSMHHLLAMVDEEKFYQALHHRAHYLLNGYFWPEMAMFYKRPDKIVGSFFIRHHRFRVRIDDVQHYISGLVAYRRFLMKRNKSDHHYFSEKLQNQYMSRNNIKGRLILKYFDSRQLFRFFVDGQLQERYQGWVGYESGEPGSIQALLNAFAYMLERFDLHDGIDATYLLDLHKVCMTGVQTKNPKSSPGDLRCLNSGMPFYASSTTIENIQEILKMREKDGTHIFNNKDYQRTADDLDANKIYDAIQSLGKLNYRNWYPNLTQEQKDAIEKKKGLQAYYKTKNYIQMQFAERVDEIVNRFNVNIKKAETAEVRLLNIAKLVRELELLHPFPDGNCRTFACILLNQLLLNYDFLPTCLYNPNWDGELSLLQWIDEIKKGMAVTQRLLLNPNSSEYRFSIESAKCEDVARFNVMAKDAIQKINSYNEVYLTPERLETFTEGVWITSCKPYQRFAGVGIYNSVSMGDLYFACEIEKWKKEGVSVKDAINRVVQKGIKAIVVDDSSIIPDIKIPVFLVKNALQAFKQAASAVRQSHNPLTILITGTEGKSGAKIQLHHLLSRQVNTHAVLNSANTEVPVLRSLINLSVEHVVEINEVSVGANEDVRVERSNLVNADICLFTNIGPNHMDMHKTMQNVLIAKSSVVQGMRDEGLCIVNKDNEYASGLIREIKNRKDNIPIYTYGSQNTDDAQLLSSVFDKDRFGWNVHARIDGVIVDYFLPLAQSHAPLASVGILLTVAKMGLDVVKAACDFASVVPFETMGKVEKLDKEGVEFFFYDQSRRGGISGMKSAFADIANMKVSGKVVALVGGISVLNDSEWTQEAHHQLANLVNNSPIKRLYTTGSFMNYVSDKLATPAVAHSDDIETLAKWLIDDIEEGDLLFIIGSAYLYLGRVSELIKNLLSNKGTQRKVVDKSKLPLEFRMLLVYQAVAKGETAARATALQAVSYSDYKKTLTEYKTYTDYRASILYNFFNRLDVIASSFSLKCVNDDVLSTAYYNRVFSLNYCKRWFNNIDKKPGIDNKSFFGSFYQTPVTGWLLHFEVASQHLHMGLVRCEYNEDGIHLIKKISESESQGAIQYWCDLGVEGLVYRTWSIGWLSIDLGSVIQPTKFDEFNLLHNFENTLVFQEKVLPIFNFLRER